MEHGQETMTIVDENGNEHVCEVIFTFDSEEFGKSYVLYHVLDGEQKDDDEEVEIHASAFRTFRRQRRRRIIADRRRGRVGND